MKPVFLFFILAFGALQAEEVANTQEKAAISSPTINLKEVFVASPIIYSALIILSLASLTIWLYTLLSLRKTDFVHNYAHQELRECLQKTHFQEALILCQKKNTLLSKMVIAAISSRHLGIQSMHEMMKSEGRRASNYLWQRIDLLNDVVVIAPMLGLAGTVIGMFYAFYDIHRSAQTMLHLFDGLGIAVGTTVAGLIVAILSMILSTTLKYRLIHILTIVENQAYALSHLIHPRKESL